MIARIRPALPVLAVAVLAVLLGGHGRDHMPLVIGLRAELAGGSAYSAAVAAQISDMYMAAGPGRCESCAAAGFAYPLPAVLLVAPIAWLPAPMAAGFAALSGLVLAAGLRLTGMPWWWLLYAPLVICARTNNITLLLVGLVLVGIWAWRGGRWRVVAVVAALTIAAKPQASLLLGGWLAWLAWQHGARWSLAVACSGVAAATLALDPLWPIHWLSSIGAYRESISTAYYGALAIPLALLLLWRRLHLPALAVAQIGALPVGVHPYTFAPLLAGYVGMPRLVLALAVWLSWLAYPLGGVMSLAPWLALALCGFAPLIAGGIIGYEDTQHEQGHIQGNYGALLLPPGNEGQ
jgi:hypothetical protein